MGGSVSEAARRAVPLAVLLALAGCRPAAEEVPYNAMGERVGEVTDQSAIVHTRLTARPARVNNGYVQPGSRHGMRPEELKAMPLPAGMPIERLDGACPGKAGRVRLIYSTDPGLARATTAEWAEAGAATDYTQRFAISGLASSTTYYYAVEMAGVAGTATRRGAVRSFRTAPKPGDWRPVKFTAITCHDYICKDLPTGFRTYVSMKKLAPDFLVSNGDNVYYDTETPRVSTIELARHHWHRMYSLPAHVDLFSSTSAYFTKDDHDTFEDDCWSTREPHRVEPLTYQQLRPVYFEQLPVGPVPYRKFRWGKGLEIWLVESRDYRSPNPMPDGPDKTLWGKEQKEWLKRTMLESDAQFRVLITPTPVVGPDEPGRDFFQWPGGNGDNHTNQSFGTEGREIRQWVKDRKLTNLFAINGDRHWQYFSVDPSSGLHEFSTGPVADTHTVKPFPENREYHRFLRFKGGFLSVSLEGSERAPRLVFRFHDVDGAVLHEYVAKK